MLTATHKSNPRKVSGQFKQCQHHSKQLSAGIKHGSSCYWLTELTECCFEPPGGGRRKHTWTREQILTQHRSALHQVSTPLNLLLLLLSQTIFSIITCRETDLLPVGAKQQRPNYSYRECDIFSSLAIEQLTIFWHNKEFPSWAFKLKPFSCYLYSSWLILVSTQFLRNNK